MKVSDFITEYLLQNGINQCFSVTGGFAMHLNDSFGQKMNVVYTHGENPAGYAAIGYSSLRGEPSVCCVTAGCGATNAVTPCMIAYQDSVPVFFISGQVHKNFNIRTFKAGGRTTRTYFGSDTDIIAMVEPITKFAHELWDPVDLLTVLDECIWNLKEGRPGPVWLSIPLDVQSMLVPDGPSRFIEPSPTYQTHLTDAFHTIWSGSKRPLILAGNGIHLSRCEEQFNSFVKKQGVPHVVSFFGVDLNDDYIGKVGLIGNRSGNFAIQNCDVLLCLGCRLSKSITGYDRTQFARECTVIYVDIDETEFIEEKKIDLEIRMKLQDFFRCDIPVCSSVDEKWIQKTGEWKQKWSYELPPNEADPSITNPYPVTKSFFEKKPANSVTVASSGSLYCMVYHMFKYKAGDRFISSGHGDMGYEVPVAIGAAFHGKKVFAFVGDGSFQLNLQELQTIKTYNLPVIIVYYNNGGYGAIQITQNTIFKREYGTTVKSGIECPDIKKIATAYDIPYYSHDTIDFSTIEGPAIVEVKCLIQERRPKLSNKLLANGTFMNLPYEDMFPFMDRAEMDDNMFINQLNI